MKPARSIIIAGAGIGGLTAALALSRRGWGVLVLDQARRLNEIGAGVQLSPNASRILDGLGLAEQLRPYVAAPQELKLIDAPSARLLARAPLGLFAAQRYRAPYWVIHRGDLQAVLLNAVSRNSDITLCVGARVERVASDTDGVVVFARGLAGPVEHRGIALVGADGLWSTVRASLGHRDRPRFAGHTAWRALVPAETLASELRAPALNLWLGPNAHLVHYPVRGGKLINIVAIARDDWREAGWTALAGREDVLARYPAEAWPAAARTILEAPGEWQKWALCDRAPLPGWGHGPITLLGDAAHPMLPYLAQGAAMAIEDAAVLARRLAETPNEPQSALRAYEHQRRPRTAQLQRAARRNGLLFHLGGGPRFVRNLALGAIGNTRLTTRYDWLYGWNAK